MDPRLLLYFNEELAYIREMGAEFAQEFPKVARRLSMEGVEVADPYVERLLEGFAFLTARVQLKLDAEYPHLIASLLETIYPNFLSPVPSMLVARLHPDLTDPGLLKGAAVPKGSAIESQLPRGQNTRCIFRTAHEVRLWPVDIANVQYVAHIPDVPLAQLPVSRSIRSALRIRLRAHGGARFSQLPVDSLEFHITAAGDAGYRLFELLSTCSLGTLVWAPGAERSAVATRWRLAVDSVAMTGDGDDQALLMEHLRGHSAYRLLQEMSAMPQRFLFFRIKELARRLATVDASEVDLVIPFSRYEAGLEALVDGQSLSLYCTPAINLFSKRLDRVQIDPGRHEYHAIVDRTRPLDFEVHSIKSVTGYGAGGAGSREFLPLYAAFHTEPSGHGAYFSHRRVPRTVTARQAQHGTRSSYVGNDVHVAIVDEHGAPYDDELRQLAIDAWVTNRDLALLLPGSPSGELNRENLAWSLDGAPAVRAVECLRGPTRPVSRIAEGIHGWSLVNHLALQQIGLGGQDPKQSAASLRNGLRLYGPTHDTAWQRQVDGIVAVHVEPVTRRLPFGGPLAFGSGMRVTLEADEHAFQGMSAVLFGAVLDHFFARHAAINTFTELVLRSTTRGVLSRWPPRVGVSAVLSV